MRTGIKSAFLLLLWAVVGAPLLLAITKPHVVFLGPAKKVPYSIAGDPAGALPDEKELRVRPLIVDGKLKEWTNGESHPVTDRTFVSGRSFEFYPEGYCRNGPIPPRPTKFPASRPACGGKRSRARSRC